jgi:hypothetical protein
MTFIDDEKVRLKLSKIDPKMTPYKLIKNRLKLTCHGGVENRQNRSNLTGGVRGVLIYKFFEILQFSTKAPPLFDPQK